MDAVVDAELEVVHDDVGMGEVDDGLGAAGDQGIDVVVDVHLGDQLQVVRGGHRLAHLGPDLAPGPQDAHLPHLAHRLNLSVPSGSEDPAGAGPCRRATASRRNTLRRRMVRDSRPKWSCRARYSSYRTS